MIRRKLRFLGWAIPLTLLGTSCRSGQARTLYVAPDGSNGSAGTLAQPLADPASALRRAAPGDTVVLRAGRYDLAKPLRITEDGITLAGAPGEAALLAAPTSDEADVAHVVVITASRVTLSNLEIRGGSYYGVKIDVGEAGKPARSVTLRDCRIGGTGRDCVKTFNADDLLIEDCDIGPSGVRDASNAEGIDSIGSHGVTIRRNHVHDTATNGIYLKGGATDGLVEACRIENVAHAAGILLGQDTDAEFMRDGAQYEAIRCTARNNIVVNTGGAGLGTYSGDNISFQNNTLYNVARESSAGIWVGINRRNIAARAIDMKNNIVVTSGERPFVYLLKAQGPVDSDYNLFSTLGKAGHFRIERNGKVSTLTLSAWQQSTGGDKHSKNSAPRLDAANLFRPLSGSPAVSGGIELPGLTSDFRGKPRHKGKRFDIGATVADG